MEGPQLSTKAESHMHRQWGGDIIGMTLCPEAKLAREAEIACCPLTMVSDYDCWHETEESVTAESALAVLGTMSAQVNEFLPELIDVLGDTQPSAEALNALGAGLVTDLSTITENTKKRLEPILRKYLS
jgi:5'-methylthioadenosine phosphorylase